MEEDGIGPLVEAKRKLEAAMQGYLDKVAVLRKKAEALTAAINVMRSNDSELLADATRVQTPIKPKRIVQFNEQVAEEGLLQIMREKGPLSKPDLILEARMHGIQASVAGLVRILKTSPYIEVTGIRESTRYGIKGTTAQ